MTETTWTRRRVLKAAGLAAGGSTVTAGGLSAEVPRTVSDGPFATPPGYEWKAPGRPVTGVIIGAGNRGRVYAGYARSNPAEWRIVGVAEPIRHRNEAMGSAHGVPEESRFATWQHLLERPRMADVCVVTTPDHLHYGPAMAALDAGYDVLVEKAIAQSWSQCRDILELARRKGAIVGVGHVLRYSPYFRMLRHAARSGYIGRIVSIQHLEPVEHLHMAHAFVRGNWSNSRLSTPMLLSKSCHDLDILRWIVGTPCRRVQSFGGLSLFRKEMAPPGATPRCSGGCAVEADCPFSALSIYLRRKTWLSHKDTPGQDDESILEWLKRSPYGRCVFLHDNDVVDHQTVNMEFEGGVTAAFSMEGLTSYAGRRTRICGTDGDIVGDEETISLYSFSRQKRWEWNVKTDAAVASGHGGGDYGLVRDLVQAVSRRDEGLLSSSIAESMESHLIGFRAEESRSEGGTLKVVQS